MATTKPNTTGHSPENVEATETGLVTLRDVRNDPKVKAYIEGANELLNGCGYTEHGQRHANIVSSITRYILEGIGADPRQVELGAIAAYLHDVGNVLNRIAHPMTGGMMAFTLLQDMGMEAHEIAVVMGAIGNHEESDGTPYSDIAAAVIIADKSDVHYSRVQNPLPETYDIHDRVNHAVQRSRVQLNSDTKEIVLELEVNTEVASVMEYFEIFIERMVACRLSADRLGFKFKLSCNGTFLE